MTGKETLGKLKGKLDKIFSRYIRLRDCNGTHYGPCITCHKIIHWKDGDAGHFITRGRLATRFDPRNVNLQCKYCNGPMSGQQYQHGLAINVKFGDDVAEELSALANTSIRISRGEYADLIGEYNERVKQLSTEAELG